MRTESCCAPFYLFCRCWLFMLVERRKVANECRTVFAVWIFVHFALWWAFWLLCRPVSVLSEVGVWELFYHWTMTTFLFLMFHSHLYLIVVIFLSSTITLFPPGLLCLFFVSFSRLHLLTPTIVSLQVVKWILSSRTHQAKGRKRKRTEPKVNYKEVGTLQY